jgi:hypothetical protein
MPKHSLPFSRSDKQQRGLLVLWSGWWQIVQAFRPACSRNTTFLWLAVAMAAFIVRPDLAGITSMIRAMGLAQSGYYALLHFFHTKALDLDRLTLLWTRIIFTQMKRWLVFVGDRPVVIVDGLKRPKEGRKMPGVRIHHQQSKNNSKPAYIMGHYFQQACILACAAGQYVAIPLTARIHNGLVWNNRKRPTLLDKLKDMILHLEWKLPITVVADAYYAAGKIADPLLKAGHHLVTRIRSNGKAYLPPPINRKKGRGRPPTCGAKVILKGLFSRKKHFQSAPSPVYAENNVAIRYASRQWLWKPLKKTVLFVWVIHPLRGRIILMSTDLNMQPLDVIRLYGWRFKIELEFRSAVHALGGYYYHFWMQTMDAIGWGSRDQSMTHRSDAYKKAVLRKLGAYERFVQLALITQGILIYLGLRFRRVAWRSLDTYRRSVNTSRPPSDWTLLITMRNGWNYFLTFSPKAAILAKFIQKRKTLEISPFSCHD